MVDVDGGIPDKDGALPWQQLESITFIPEVLYSARRHIPIDTVVFRLKKGIKNGIPMYACFWAAEMDASGWSELLWDELIDMCFSDIGLVSPSSPCYLRKYYKMWKNEVDKGGKPSYQNIDACRIVMSMVKYLCGTWKNRTIAHASMWSVMKAQNGMLTTEEWNSSLGMGNKVDRKLSVLYEGHTPAMKKRIDNLLLGLVRNNEFVCIRHSDYMVISGNVHIVWKLIVLCIEYTHGKVSKNFYSWFIPYLKDYKSICNRYIRQCEQDKYLKGGHLDIDAQLYPQDLGVFEFEDGSHSYPYMEHPYSEEYEKYSTYMPYGPQIKVTNARRLNYVRRCVIQTVTLLCRGMPNGVDIRTPMDYICEDIFAKEMYSDTMPAPQENIETNFNRVPSDWSTRESQVYTTCDARHWWVMADSVVPIMEIHDKYSDAAFDALLEQENYYGDRASEEFALYRYIHSLAHYEGIVQIKPNMDSRNVFDTSHILDEEECTEESSSEEDESSEVMETITSSKEIADLRMDIRKRDVEALNNVGNMSKLIEDMRGDSSTKEEDMAEDLPTIMLQECITYDIELCKRTYSIIKSISMIRAIMTHGIEYCTTEISNIMVGKSDCGKRLIYKSNLSPEYNFVVLEDSGEMVNSSQFIKSWNGHDGKDNKESLFNILAQAHDSSQNGFMTIKTESFEKTILMEVFLSILLGDASKTFPMPLVNYLNEENGRLAGMHCQEAFGVVCLRSGGEHQCYWNHLKRFCVRVDGDIDDRYCQCTIQDKNSWIELLRDLYTRHHSFMISEVIRWNTMITSGEQVALIRSAYIVDDPEIRTGLKIPPMDTILKRIKKTYSSILSNSLVSSSIAYQTPTALDILFCS